MTEESGQLENPPALLSVELKEKLKRDCNLIVTDFAVPAHHRFL